MATINVPADYLSIQDAVNAASAGDTILVGPGSYNENVVIDKPLSLLSTAGRGATTIQGDGAGGELGAIQVAPGVDDVTIGAPGAGFTIVGINGNGAIEKAAIYLQGNHDNILIQGNDVVANGDAGLLSEFGAAVTNATIDGNVFSGQTFVGAQPDGNGFGTQFTVGNNVPRQLVTMGNGGAGPYVSSNIVFTNNDVTGTAGGITSDDNVSEQGNTLVTIDAADSTISDNSFTGFTNRFATAVRARGPNTEISDNSFDASASGSDNTLLLFVDNKGMPANYDGNSFIATDGTETLPSELTPGGDDTFVPGGGNDDIEGGGGIDTAIFSGAIADYSIVDMGGGVVVVTDLRPGSPDGANTLRRFERFEFTDGVVLASGPIIDLDFDDSSGATGNGFQAAFTEGGGPIFLNNGDIRITDPDDTTLDSATVVLTNPLDGALESLAINAALAALFGITATVAGDGHSISLSGTATRAAYQAVLGTVSYDNFSGAPDTTARQVAFQVNDGTSDSPVAIATVALTAVDQAPALDLDRDDSTAPGTGAAAVFAAGGGPVSVTDADVDVGDADGTTLASATVTLTNALDGAAEALGIDLILAGNLEIAVAFGPDNQSITLTGVADHVFYEVLLASVTYDNGAALPTLADRVVEIAVNDGTSNSAVATSTITLVPNPQPADDLVAVQEDSGANDLTMALLANDGDTDGDPLTIAGASGPANGAVAVAPDGTLTYAPDGDFVGTDSFVYTVTDGNGGLATATATVTVTNVNDPPVLTDPGGVEHAFGFETGALVDGDGFGWFDNGGSPGAVASGTGGVVSEAGGFHMTVGVSAGAQQGAFTRFGGYSDTFPADGFTTEVAIYLDLTGIAGTDRGFDYSVAINDQAGDHHRDFIFTVKEEGGVYEIGVSHNADTDGTPLDPQTTGGPLQTVTASGWYSFRHTFSDDGGVLRADMEVLDAVGNVVGSWSLSNPGDDIASTIGGNRYGWIFNNQVPDLPVDSTARLGPAALPPVFVEDQPTGVVVNDDFVIADMDDTEMEGATVSIANFVAGEDVLQFTDMLGIAGSFDPLTGLLTLSGTADIADYEAALSSVRYFNANTQDPDTATREVVFTVSDGEAASDPVTVEVAVVGSNDDPAAANDNATVAEDSGATDLTATVLANDNDPDGDMLTVVGADGAANGTLSVAPDGTLTYEADTDFNGTDAFTYTVTDGNGGATATALATVTVTGVNDPPVLNGGPVFGVDFDDGSLNDGSTGFFDFGVGTSVVPSGTAGIASLSGGFHATVGTSTPGSQGGAFTRWGGYESVFPPGGYTTQMSIYLDVAAHAGNDVGFTYSNGLNRPDGTYRTEFYFNVGTTGDPGDGFVIGASQRANDVTPGVPATPGPDYGPTVNVTTSGWYTFQFEATESGPGIRLDFTLLDAGGNVVGTWSTDRPDLVRGVDIGGNRYGWVFANEIPDLPVDNIFKGEAAATPGVVYTEDDPPVVVNDAITVDDVDDVNLEGATVAFVGGYVMGEDILAFAGLGNISGSFDAATGILTLTGSDSLANYEAALRAVTYANLAGDDPTAGTRMVRFIANDGDDDSNAVLTEIEVVAVNDGPLFDLDGDNSSGAADPDYQTAAAAGGAPVLLNDGDIVLTDADDASLDGAVIALAATPDGANELLTVDAGLAAGFGVTVIGNGTGAITLSGAASAADYRAIFATATYENQAGPGATAGVREVVFTADDGEEPTTASAFVTVSVPPSLDLDFDDSTAGGIDFATTFVEGSVPVLLNDGDIRVTDPDGTTLQGATVVLSNPIDGADETLSIDVALATGFGITVVVPGDGHSILLTGEASHAAYQAALGTIRYHNASQDPDTADRLVEFTVNDGVLDSGAATATVTLDPVNQAPVVDLDADDSSAPGIDAAATFVAHHGPVGILGPDVDIADVDGAVIAAATVTLTNPADGAAEALSIDTVLAGNLGLAVVFGADNQSITITGAANHLTYEVLLATVRYDNAAADPTAGDRTVEVTVNDGFDDSAIAISTVTVVPDPSAADDTVTVAEDSGANDLTLTLLGNDGDADGDSLTVIAASGTANGTLDVAPDGTVTYTPDADYHGTDGFTYTITDGNGGQSTATVTVTVTPVADDPVAGADTVVVAEDSTGNDLTAALLANDTDADGDSLTVVAASGAGNGSVDVAPDGKVTYTPDSDYFGTDGFVYTVTDGNGGATATAGVTVTVNPLSDDPTAADDLVTVAEDSGANDVTATLLANDGDVDGDALTVIGVAGAANGTVGVVGGVVTYTPGANYFGSDSFTYTITDGNGGATASATATVAVTSINDAPTLDLDFNDSTAAGTGSAATFTEGGPAVLLNDGDIRIQDVDSPTIQSASVVLTNPLNGGSEVLTVNATLAASFGITAVVAGDGHSIALTGTASRLAYQAVLGTVRYANGSIAPDTTPREIQMTVNDGIDDSNVATALVSISAVDQAPVLDLDADNSSGAANPNVAAGFVEGGGAVVVTNGDVVLTDVDSADLTRLTVQLVNPLDGGAEGLSIDTVLAATFGLTVVATASSIEIAGAAPISVYRALIESVAYDNGSATPDETTRTIRFQVESGAGSASNPAFATVTVAGANDAPTADDDAVVVVEDSGANNVTAQLLAGDADADGDSLTVVGASGAASGTVAVLGDGTVLYTPDDDFAGPDSFAYTITDGNGGATASALVTVTVTPVADDPTVADDIVTVLEDTVGNDLTAAILANDGDADGDGLTVIGASGTANGAIAVAPDGSVTYTPDADHAGTDGFTYTVTDGNGGATASATVTISVAGQADDPAAANDMATVAEDSGANDLTALLLANDGDVDGDNLTVVSAGGAGTGTVAVAPDGTLTYMPGADFVGTDSFTYTVTDGNGGATASASVTVTVTPMNDDPAAADDLVTVAEDSGGNDVTALLLANDGDVDGDAVTVVGAAGAANGTVDVAPDGTVTFTPDADYFGSDSFTYTITDGNGGATATATATVTVTPVADDPAPADDAVALAEDAGAVDLTADLLANDIDVDGDSLTVVGASGAANGSLAVALDGTLTYQPDADYSGTDAFVYTVTDGNGGATATAAVTVTVTPDADPPVALADAVTVAEDSGATDITAALLANDTDADGDMLTVVGASGAANGTVDVAPDGTVTFTPDGDYAGTDGFVYTVTDGNGGGTASAAVAVTVTPVADDPVAADDTVAVAEDSGATDLTALLLANDGDVDGDGLTIVGASGAANGTVDVAPDGTLTFTPDADFAGTDGFTYTVTDGNGGATVSATVAVTVSPVADAPAAADDSLTVTEDSGATDLTAALLANDLDPDGDALTVVAASGAGAGTVEVAPDGTLTYAPGADFTGTEAFTYTITDGNGGATASATATVTVTPVSDDPTAGDDAVTVAEDSGPTDVTALLLANDADVDGDSLTVVGVGGAANGTLDVAPDGTVTFTPDADFSGTDGFTYTVTDGNGGATATATVAVTVAPVSDPPSLDLDFDDSTSAGTDFATTYTEGAPPVLLNDGDIRIVDIDDGSFQSATVTLTNPVDGAQETLAINMALAATFGISAVLAPDGHSIALSGVASATQYQAILGTVTYTNGSIDPDTTPRTVAFTVNDGASDSNVAVATVTIDPVNQAPTLDLDGDNSTGAADPDSAIQYFEDGPAVLLTDGDIVIADVDGPGIDSATVTIADPQDAGEALTIDSILAGNLGVTVTVTGGGTGLDLQATGPLSNLEWQQLLQTVAYDNAAPEPTGTSRAVEFTVYDGESDSNVAVARVAIVGVNDDPEAADDAIVLAEDAGAVDVTAGLLANDSDADGDGLTVVAADGAAGGTVAFAPDGTVTFAPDADFNGTDSFTYTITDGNGGATASATVAVTVTPVADDPVPADDAVTVAEDSGANDLTVAVLANDTDGDGDSLTVVGGGGAANGTVVVAPDGTVSYTPDGDFAGTDSFTYTVTDGNGGATASATVTVTVTPANDDPVAADDAIAVAEDSGATDVTAALLANDTDIDGDALTVVGATGAANGTVDVAPDGTVTFTPDADFAGTDSFVYTVTDGNGGATASATTSVTVTGAADDPVAADDAVTVAEDSGATDLTAALLANDGDPDGDGLTVVGAAGAENGSIDVAPDGTVTFTPDGDFSGTDAFTYTITDGNGGATATATATITVTPVADDPAAADDALTVAEDSGPNDLTAGLLANDSDADGDSLTIIGVAGAGNGSLSVAPDGTVTYEPDGEFSGTDAFTYTVTDGNGGATASATATITVTSAPDAPALGDDAISVAEDSGPSDVTATLLANDTDADGDALTIVGAGGLANGTVDVAPDGTVTFTPDTDFFGTDSFAYTVTDGNGGLSSATATVTVTPLPDDPTVADDMVAVGEGSVANDLTAAILANDGDVDGDALTVIAASGTSEGSLALAPDGTVTYTPDGGYLGTDSFTYTVTDGNGGATASATVTIDVTDVNDDPAANDDAVAVAEDSVANDLTAAILANDADADVADGLTVVAATGTANGTLDLAPDGTVTYSPTGDFNGTDSFTYTITDGNGGATASATATITVTGVNDDPVATDDAAAVDEDSADNDLTALALGNDTDVDGDGLTVVGADGATSGSVTVAPDGTLLYTPDAGYIGTDSFTYTITDGNGGATATATVAVAVGPVNDDPTAADDLAALAEDSGANDLTALLLANDGDVDGDALTVVGADGAVNGTVAVAPDGTVTYEPAADFNGTDSFTYTITDGNGGATATATATVTVTPVADDPVAVDDGPIEVTENIASTMDVSLLANDLDADGDVLTIIGASGAPNGSLAFNGAGELVYTPDTDFVGTDSFTYTVTDGNGGATSSATATVNVVMGLELAIGWELFGSALVSEGATASYTVQFAGEPIPAGESVSIEIGIDLPGGANGADASDLDLALLDAVHAAIDALGPDSGVSLVANRIVFEAGGPTALTFDLPIRADETTEGLEVYTVTIAHPSSGEIVEFQDLQATTILDTSQDAPPVSAAFLPDDGPGATTAQALDPQSDGSLLAGSETADGGDNHFAITGVGFRPIAGGDGYDTVAILGEAVDLNLSTDAPGALTGIERIDLTGSGDNALHLAYDDLLEVADPLGSLTIVGDAGDEVSAELSGAGFAYEGIEDGFHIYTNGTERLLVAEEITDQSVVI